jgi:ribosome-binding ATPase YchF (GTP1/OBG family)
VLRCFGEGDVTHVTGAPDPAGDAGMVATELMLADMERLNRRRESLIKKTRGADSDAEAELAVVDGALKLLDAGRPARELEVKAGDENFFKGLGLLTAKPVLYVLNVDEEHAAQGSELSEKAAAMAAEEGSGWVVISARIEEEIAQLADAAERMEFLETLGLAETGLARVVAAGYELLGLITFFTVNEKEARAWTPSPPSPSRKTWCRPGLNSSTSPGW